MATICFQSSCYQKSYKHLLLNGQLNTYLSKFPRTSFKEKQLIINNMVDIVDFSKLFNDFNIYYSSNNINGILNNFEIAYKDFTKKFKYKRKQKGDTCKRGLQKKV